MLNHYAQDTQVPVDRSKAEIERLVQRYGAEEMVTGWRAGKAMIQFKMEERQIRFVLPLPLIATFAKTDQGRDRTQTATQAAWEQACRQRWRALTLTIKAKLESAASGIEEFETAFMGQIVMPNGKTVAEQVLPMIEDAYRTHKMPTTPLLKY